MNYQFFSSPIGTLRLVSNGSHLSRIELAGRHRLQGDDLETDDAVLSRCSAQLEEYFDGARRAFDLPLAAVGTDFQRAVWRALGDIPYGTSRSYREIARTLGKPAAVRAVGAANGANPLPIVVPCHRVVGSDGRLTGYAGGLDAKRLLLELEGVLAAG